MAAGYDEGLHANRKRQERERQGGRREQHDRHGEPQDGAQSQARQSQCEPLARRKWPGGQTRRGNLVERVGRKRQQKQKSENQEERIRATRLHAAYQRTVNQQRHEEKEVIDLDRFERREVAANRAQQGPEDRPDYRCTLILRGAFLSQTGSDLLRLLSHDALDTGRMPALATPLS